MSFILISARQGRETRGKAVSTKAGSSSTGELFYVDVVDGLDADDFQNRERDDCI